MKAQFFNFFFCNLMHLICLLVLICCSVFDASLAHRGYLSCHSHLHSCCYSDSHSLLEGHCFFFSFHVLFFSFFFFLVKAVRCLLPSCLRACWWQLERRLLVGQLCARPPLSSLWDHHHFTPFAFSLLPWRLNCWSGQEQILWCKMWSLLFLEWIYLLFCVAFSMTLS